MQWPQAVATLHTRAPVAIHILPEPVAGDLGITLGGALLVRPDGQPVRRWAKLARALHIPGLGKR